MSRIDAATGSLLDALTRAAHTRRALEIGTGHGEAALWIARALPDDGMLITVERDEARALEARARFAAAGVGNRISVMIGDAARYLHKIAGPFDLVIQHVDASQRRALRPRLAELLRQGGLLATLAALDEGELTLMIKR